MKSFLLSFKPYWIIMLIALPFLTGCPGDPANGIDPYAKDVFSIYQPNIMSEIIDTNKTFTVNIKSDTTITYRIAVGSWKYDEEFDGYEGTNWKIVNVPNDLPSFISIKFTPDTLPEDESNVTLTIKTVGELVNGIYKVRIDANGKLFNNPKSLYLQLQVNKPQVNLLPKVFLRFTHDTLVVAPGESKTNLMTLDSIKTSQNFQITYQTNNIGVLKSWINPSDSIFTKEKNTATWTVTVPETANPNNDEEGVNLYLKYLNTGEMVDFEGNKNGFIIEVAGYIIPEVLSNKTVKFGDTCTFEVNYLVRGNGTFTPKLIPPTSIPKEQIEIFQDVKSITKKRNVKVIYKVFFKNKPANKNVNFDVGGDISYGKAVPKKLLIVVN